MTRRNPPAKWVLPGTINPIGTVCVTIPIPDEPFYRAAFWGALLNLASAYKWQDDDSHSARLVALVWRDIIDNLRYGNCLPANTKPGIELGELMSQQIRISPDDACIIQMWCIDHWENWYDPRDCIATGSGQAGSRDGGQPAPGTTQQYCQTVLANVPYLFPVQVNAGDVITPGGMSGEWTDGVGGLLSAWRCAAGQGYLLGVCAGGTTTDPTDPLPTIPHMKLLAYIAGVYYPLTSGTPFSVPAGVVNENMLLVPNTADTTIARGSVSACITIEAAAALPLNVSYAAGSGPSQVTNGGTYVFTSDAATNPDLDLTFAAPVKVTLVASTLDTPACPVPPCEYYVYQNPSGTNIADYFYPPTHVMGIPAQTSVLRWIVNGGNGAPQYSITAKIEF